MQLDHAKSVSRHVLEALLILSGAFLVFFAYMFLMKVSLKDGLFISVFNAIMWMLMWKGNEIITNVIDKYVSWLENPAKRLWIGVVFSLVYIILISIIITVLFYFLTGGTTSLEGLYSTIIEATVISALITFFIMSVIYGYNFLKAWRQTAIDAERLRRENITSQYEALKSQVNPHFLFNTLNALSSLIYEDRDKAIDFINKFSDVYRYVLDSRDKEIVPLHEELDFICAYVFLLKSRYEDNLEIDIDHNLGTGYLPPMSLQLLIENAVKHNVISDESHMSITIKRNEDYLIVANRKNPKVDRSDAKGMGLDNIRSRFSILTDTPVKIVNSNDIFEVSIPILKLQPS